MSSRRAASKNNNTAHSVARSQRPALRAFSRNAAAAARNRMQAAENAAYLALMRGSEINMGTRLHNLTTARKTMNSARRAQNKLPLIWGTRLRNLPPELGAAVLAAKEENNNARNRAAVKNTALKNAALRTAAMRAAYAPRSEVYMPAATRKALPRFLATSAPVATAAAENTGDYATIRINNGPFRVGNSLASLAAAAPLNIRVVPGEEPQSLSPAEILRLVPRRNLPRRNRAV